MPLPVLRRTFLLLLLVSLLFTATLFAEEPWDAPPFSSEPKALITAAEKVDPGDKGVILLLDEAVFSYEADGSTRTTWRMMYRVVTEASVEPNAQVEASWAPWYDQKPVITARVVTKSGTVHMLDASAVAEAPSGDSLDIFSDNKILHAPLPAVEVGAVVEYVITVDGRSPMSGAGTASVFSMARRVPVHRTRLVLDTPLSIEPRIVNRSALKPTVEEKDNRRRTTFVSDRIEPEEKPEFFLPYDEAAFPYIAFSTGKSWQEIAESYSKIVDQQIEGSDLQKLVRTAIGSTKDRREIIARLLAAIQKDIRYAGVEVAEGSIIPRPPATVLRNKYGDCKDKATLLVAMLRAAGIPAHVALLRAGTDLDAHADLPGLGMFNHAIVRVDGTSGGDDSIWVDPTDEFARAGELPIEDQGRLALVAAPSMTSLTRTPESPSSANRYVETRTFELPEDGKAHVVETTEAVGVDDATQRRYYASTEAKRYREGMESYVKSYYFAKTLAKFDVTDPHDLTKPFRLTLDATESGSGIVRNGEAAVAVHPGALFNGYPTVLRDWKEPQPDDDPKDLPKKRVHDFIMPVPKVKVWTIHIVPPVGYAARALPSGETRKLGVVTYKTDYAAQPDGSVVATLSIDSGKRRLTAAEFEETRVAISKLIREPLTEVGFDLLGQRKLNDGDVGGALAEFRKLAALHPGEAQHHVEMARALLAGGLGESAREEARKAVAIEPKSAQAQLTLAETLRHDLLGRPYRTGVDIAGAVAALRKAKELEPDEVDGRLRLARLLTFGEDGKQFGRNARLIDSIAEYRALAKDLGEKGQQYDGELMLVLAHAGHFQELKDLAATSTEKQRRNLGRIMAIAAMDGTDAALRELGAFDLETRRAYAANLAQYLLGLRLYPQAAAMLELSLQGTPQASQSALYIDTVRKARRIEDVPPAPNDPADLVRRLFLAVSKGDKAEAMALMPADVQERTKKLEEKDGDDPFEYITNQTKDGDLPPVSMVDVMYSMFQVQKEGSDETGYRLRLRMSVDVSSGSLAMFVTREDGHYMLRATNMDDSVGIAVLRFVDAGQVDVGRQWLNWAREPMQAFGGDDPFGGSAFAKLWSKSKVTATADEVRFAASVLVAEHTGETAKELEAMREKTESEDVRTLIDRALARGYSIAKDWARLVPVARRLAAKEPDSPSAFISLSTALSYTGGTAEAESLAKARLERMPKDRDALRALSQNAAAKFDFVGAERYAQQLVDDVTPDRVDYNNAAWYGLLAGNLEHAMENAHKATTGDKGRDTAASFHTLAAVYAETGKTLEAREALLSSMDQRQHDQPQDEDWYVLGRIAESYGVREAAIAAYKRVAKDESPQGDIWRLTSRRLGQIK